MASAAALNLVSASSSSSERVSSRCIEARALFCSMRTCRCLAMAGQSRAADPVPAERRSGLAGQPPRELVEVGDALVGVRVLARRRARAVLERPVDERRAQAGPARALQVPRMRRDEHELAGLDAEQARG